MKKKIEIWGVLIWVTGSTIQRWRRRLVIPEVLSRICSTRRDLSFPFTFGPQIPKLWQKMLCGTGTSSRVKFSKHVVCDPISFFFLVTRATPHCNNTIATNIYHRRLVFEQFAKRNEIECDEWRCCCLAHSAVHCPWCRNAKSIPDYWNKFIAKSP